ncbi:hypothetical protein [Krasilnikovia sp. MM14-A1259]|uniref:hypothetical protein n=1 Tax=Krasilnikovia sp. MM14-A1259 TaxID=3373539 RepID=UPI0038018E75
MVGDCPGDLKQPPSERSARALGARLRRAAPRIITIVVLAVAGSAAEGMTTGAVASTLHWVSFPLVMLAASGSKQWWRYVMDGRPASWRVEQGGTTALFVTDPGRDLVQVAGLLRKHGGLNFGEALNRAQNPSRPVWDDLASESAERISLLLTNAGATVDVRPRSRPSWARDVTGQ